MATRTIVTMHDDLTDEAADTTVSFGLDGRDYEIDLTDANAEEFREMLDTYIAAGRKVGGTRRRRRGASPLADVDPKAVRAWAAAKGYEVSNRGRVPAAVVQAYRAAGN
jgi:nucleoid-associated protein Lsr2